jgi:hypothetical protein
MAAHYCPVCKHDDSGRKRSEGLQEVSTTRHGSCPGPRQMPEREHRVGCRQQDWAGLGCRRGEVLAVHTAVGGLQEQAHWSG